MSVLHIVVVPFKWKVVGANRKCARDDPGDKMLPGRDIAEIKVTVGAEGSQANEELNHIVVSGSKVGILDGVGDVELLARREEVMDMRVGDLYARKVGGALNCDESREGHK